MNNKRPRAPEEAMKAAAIQRSEIDQLTGSIQERLARGEEVSQEEWDRAADLFDDSDADELVPPDEHLQPRAARPLPGLALPELRAGVSARLPARLGDLIRLALADLDNERKKR